MSHYVYAPKRDANHAELVKAYEDMHCGVIDTSSLGFGFPDVLVHFSGYCAPVEFKTENGKLSPKQERFVNAWKGPRIYVPKSIDDVIAHVTKIRTRQAGG